MTAAAVDHTDNGVPISGSGPRTQGPGRGGGMIRGFSLLLALLGACSPESFTRAVACAGDRSTGDSDRDGVCDNADVCPGTPDGVAVNGVGCVLNDDTAPAVDTDGKPSADTTDTDTTSETGETGEPPTNRAPVVGTPLISPAEVFNDTQVQCAATTSDPDGTLPVVLYDWVNETMSAPIGVLPTLVLTSAIASPGDTIRCTVTASDGSLTDSKSVTATVGDRPPTLTTPVIDPPARYHDSSLTCSATASDPDGTTPTLTYAWTNETTATALGVGTEVMLTPAVASPGDVVRCTATASGGVRSVSASADVTLSNPQAGDARGHSVLGTVRFIPAGSFSMGCVNPRDIAGGSTSCSRSNELPSRQVSLTIPFWMMESELTVGMWAALGFSPKTGGASRPVSSVNWWEALEAANEASRRDGFAECYTLSGCDSNAVGTGRECTGVTVTSESAHPKDCAGWRLPTEAEWEYAARAGADFPYSGSDEALDVAWHSGNNYGLPGWPDYGTKDVCTTPTRRNPWGVCDMSGNVAEWAWDWYATNYEQAATTDPTGPDSGVSRVRRGGDWFSSAQDVRVAFRNLTSPNTRGFGFRLIRSAP